MHGRRGAGRLDDRVRFGGRRRPRRRRAGGRSAAHELTSLVASVLDSPIPFTGSDGLTHVVYEVEVLNASTRAATITKVEVVSLTGEVLDTLKGEELEGRIVPMRWLPSRPTTPARSPRSMPDERSCS